MKIESNSICCCGFINSVITLFEENPGEKVTPGDIFAGKKVVFFGVIEVFTRVIARPTYLDTSLTQRSLNLGPSNKLHIRHTIIIGVLE